VQNGLTPPPPPSAAPPQQACPTAPHTVPEGPVQEPALQLPLTPAPVQAWPAPVQMRALPPPAASVG